MSDESLAVVVERLEAVGRRLDAYIVSHATSHDDHAAAHDRQHAADARAIDHAAASVNERLAGMNEFRATLRDQAATFATRDMLEAAITKAVIANDVTARRVAELERAASVAQGRASAYLAIWGVGVTLLSIAIGVVLKLLG